MKPVHIAFLLFTTLLSLTLITANWNDQKNTEKEAVIIPPDPLLRHVVLFSFREDAPPEKIRELEQEFGTLPHKIKEIQGYEWGINNSPEGLNKNFTHCFFLTFRNTEDRDTYLPHPAHKAFGARLAPYLEDVLVLDYWANR